MSLFYNLPPVTWWAHITDVSTAESVRAQRLGSIREPGEQRGREEEFLWVGPERLHGLRYCSRFILRAMDLLRSAWNVLPHLPPSSFCG